MKNSRIRGCFYLLFFTERTARPLRRRACRTFAPDLVFVRTRKPCVVMRFCLLGWYVRFVIECGCNCTLLISAFQERTASPKRTGKRPKILYTGYAQLGLVAKIIIRNCTLKMKKYLQFFIPTYNAFYV